MTSSLFSFVNFKIEYRVAASNELPSRHLDNSYDIYGYWCASLYSIM